DVRDRWVREPVARRRSADRAAPHRLEDEPPRRAPTLARRPRGTHRRDPLSRAAHLAARRVFALTTFLAFAFLVVAFLAFVVFFATAAVATWGAVGFGGRFTVPFARTSMRRGSGSGLVRSPPYESHA